ncbi:MAG: NAD(P)H-hydrate dehydratase [Hadesarchaea archaeon]|nr:NAD(P)H-hydrate dehydratase [Hadesarchaea archaeon]
MFDSLLIGSKMITLSRLRALEINSEWRGVSRRLLMENAGAGVVKELWKRKPPKDRVAVFVGTGNNGGDGMVVARHLLNRGVEVDLVLVGDPRNISSSEALENWSVLCQMSEDINFHVIRDSGDLGSLRKLKASTIIDAMLGAGVKGELREPISSIVESINRRKAYKVAVDTPTGLDPSTGEVLGNATKCDITVTFHDVKPGLENNEKYTGSILVSDIGIPRSASNKAGPGDVEMAVAPRGIGSHKGDNGRLLIIGGSSKFVGAPALAGLASLRAGVDLVTIAAPSEVASVVNSYSPDLITLKLPGSNLEPLSLSEVRSEIDRSTAVLIGPGLGTLPDTGNAVNELAQDLIKEHSELPVIFDADGLKLISKEKSILKDSDWVLTPHAGEFELLSDKELPEDPLERRKAVSSVAQELGCNILLKSSIDICADSSGRVISNDTGNPGMTVGGTGDVLAGVVGTFLSQGSQALSAMAGGAFLCGRAGDICSQEKGYEFTASEVKDNISEALNESKEFW